MKVILISVYCDPCSENNLRLNNVYKYLKQDSTNNSVKIITSSFKHRTKTYHDQNLMKLDADFINTPSYDKNISLKRIFNHWVFAYKLYKHIKKLNQQPDIFYCTVPTSSAVLACIFANRKAKIIIDIIDIWPESFYAINKSKKRILKFILFPWAYLSRYVYSKADLIFAESKAYGKVAKHYNKSAKINPYYLGTDHDEYFSLIQQSSIELEKVESELILCYGGNIGNSYDFKTLLDAFKHVKSENIRLIFVGDGVKKKEVEEYAAANGIKITITGYVNYPDFLKYLSYADITVNCFNKETAVVHSYKFNDYIVSGSAILNSLEGETAEMIEEYNIGLNYTDVDTLVVALKNLINDRILLEEMKSNATIVAKNILACKTIYPNMVKDMKNLLDSKQSRDGIFKQAKQLKKI